MLQLGLWFVQPLVYVQEYKCHNADILLKEDSTIDDLIDVIEVDYYTLAWLASS